MGKTTSDFSAVRFRNEKRFVVFAAISAFLTGITTIIIHNLSYPSATFEDTVHLYENSVYLAQNWTVMIHCLLVICSMLGVAVIVSRYSLPLAILGFAFFLLFAFSEWERTLNSLWYVNGLRRQYVAATEEIIRQTLRSEIRNTLYQSNIQFLLFTIGFTLGNFCNGLALISGEKTDRYLAIGLLFWSACTTCAFFTDFYTVRWMGTVIDLCNRFYQPLIRILIAVWLWQKVRI